MKLTKVSINLLIRTFQYWHVDEEYREPIYNYLVHGFNPGSFFHNVFANDFIGAMVQCHTKNSVDSLRMLVGWIGDYMPREAYGSHEQVYRWVEMPEAQRRMYLEKANLIYDHSQEMWETLKA